MQLAVAAPPAMQEASDLSHRTCSLSAGCALFSRFRQGLPLLCGMHCLLGGCRPTCNTGRTANLRGTPKELLALLLLLLPLLLTLQKLVLFPALAAASHQLTRETAENPLNYLFGVRTVSLACQPFRTSTNLLIFSQIFPNLSTRFFGLPFRSVSHRVSRQ